MGNRAVITTEDKKIGVYLHWNGGRDSIEAFLKYCDLSGFRTPESDSYGWARLVQIITNYFPGGLSVGIDKYEKLDKNNGDNGVYIIKNWKIIGREFFEGVEQKEYDLNEFLEDINNAQPESQRINLENTSIEAIKIDSENKQITKINIPLVDESVLQWLYKEIGCRTVEIAMRLNDNILWVDEEGLSNPKYFFQYKGGHQPFAGNGIIIGDTGSDSKSTNLDIAEVTQDVTFLSLEEVRKEVVNHENI